MQTLEQDNEVKAYDLRKELEKYLKQKTTQPVPVPVKVSEDLRAETITLTVNNTPLLLSRNQALDLAHALRKAANRIGAQRHGRKVRAKEAAL